MGEGLAIKAKVWRAFYPVLQNIERDTRGEGHRNIHMVVTEDKIIHFVLTGIFHGEFIQRLRLTLEDVFVLTSQPVAF